MQYHCVQCDHQFELAEGEKARCPKCMRVKSIRRVEQAHKRKAPAWLWPVAALVLIGLGLGGYAYQHSRPPEKPGEVPAEPLSENDVQRHLKALGIEAGELAQLLVAGDAVEAFADKAAGSASGPLQRAQAVVKAVRARAKAQAFVPWSMIDALPRAPLTAEAAVAKLGKDGAREQLYPLEVAALTAAALRSLDVDAMLVEAFHFEGDRSPPDPSGRLGYVVVAAAGQYFDPYGGRSAAPTPEDRTELTDLQAVGMALGLQALHKLGHARDPGGALQDADTALTLIPGSPSTRSVRAAVLIASGGGPEGKRETEAALQMRSDAPRRNNDAMIALASGDVDTAARQVALALERYPDYAAAHVTLASVHMVQLERAEARASLQKAEALDPDMPTLPLAWAQLHAESGELPQAIARAEQARELRPNNPQVHLMLGRIYRQASRYDDMREAARKVMDLVPAAQREQTREVIKQLLGPTAFEASVDEIEAAEEHAVAEPGDLDLSQGSTLLGDSDEPSVHLLDDTDSPSPGSLQLGTDPPKLHLGQGSKLLGSD